MFPPQKTSEAAKKILVAGFKASDAFSMGCSRFTEMKN